MTSFLSAITQRKKTPEQLVISAKDSVTAYLTGDNTAEENLGKRLAQIKLILYGDGDHPEVDEEKALEVGRSVQTERLMVLIVENIENIPFEARKDSALIFNNLMRKNIANFSAYVFENFDIMRRLIEGYEQPDAALNCGTMIRECIRHNNLASAILNSEYLWKFFDSYVHFPNFEVASDAFNSLRDLLVTVKNKSIASAFLDSHFDEVFMHYEVLLKKGNYVTRRRALKLLGELLLDRSNFNVMIRFIGSRDHLKTIMNFLRDPSPNIQFEAFHVFKVFVANPKKPIEISSILYKNKVKLIPFLEAFQTEKEGDEQFNDEKKLLIDTLKALERPPSSSVSASNSLVSLSTTDTPTSTSALTSTSAVAGAGAPIAVREPLKISSRDLTGIRGALDPNDPDDRNVDGKRDKVVGVENEGDEGGDSNDGNVEQSKGRGVEKVDVVGNMGRNEAATGRETVMDMLDARLNRIAETTAEFHSILVASPADPFSQGSSEPPSLQQSVSSSQETLPS